MIEKYYQGEDAINVFQDVKKNPDILSVVRKIHKLSYQIHLGDAAAQFIENSYDELVKHCHDERDLFYYFESRREEFRKLNLEEKLVDYKTKSLLRTLFMVSAELFEGTIVDIGAGDNSLGKEIIEKCAKVTKVIGIDIDDSGVYKNQRLEFIKMMNEGKIDLEECAHVVIFRFSLHHMKRDIQKKLLNEAYRILKKDGILIIIEDTFSGEQTPVFDNESQEEFMKLGSTEKYIKAMSYMDASSCFLFKEVMPFTFGFRSIEEWKELIFNCGFRSIESCFWGIPFTSLFQAPLGIIRGVK